MSHSVLHVALHFLIPGLIAILFFKKRWRLSWLIMVLTMAVDLDHLMANPVYDPNRCSINFHPLHSYIAILLYGLMTAFPKTRLIGLGLLLHMGIDLGIAFGFIILKSTVLVPPRVMKITHNVALNFHPILIPLNQLFGAIYSEVDGFSS